MTAVRYNTSEAKATFWVCGVVSLGLILAAIVNIYRQYKHADTDRIRYISHILTSVLTSLQLGIFLGYFFGNAIMIQIIWDFWVACSSISLCILSMKMIGQYQTEVKRNYYYKIGLKEKIAHGASVFGIIILIVLGTWYELQKSDVPIASLFYGLWKIAVGILLAPIIYSTSYIEKTKRAERSQRITDEELENEPQNPINTQYLWKVQRLLFFLFVLLLFLLGQSVSNLVSWGNGEQRSYTHNPLWEIAFIYLPMLSLVSVINIFDLYIPNNNEYAEL